MSYDPTGGFTAGQAGAASAVGLAGITDEDIQRLAGTWQLSAQDAGLSYNDANQGMYRFDNVNYPVDRPRSMTVDDATHQFDMMTPDQRIALQNRLYQAGYYDASYYSQHRPPMWGVSDADSRLAFKRALFDGIAAKPTGQTMDQVLDQRIADFASGKTPKNAVLDGSVHDIHTSNPDAVKTLADALSEKVLGHRLPKAMRDQLVAGVLGGEVGSQQARYNAGDTQRAANAQAQLDASATTDAQGNPVGGATDVDKFLSAIAGPESGGSYTAVNPKSGARGKYQFMPGTYASNAKEAGLDPNDWSPANQEAVARHMALQLFGTFHNWRDAAISWYAGAGAVHDSQAALDAPQNGYPSINAYADRAMGLMGNANVSTKAAAAAGQAGTLTTVPNTTVVTADASPEGVLTQDLENKYPTEAGGKAMADAYDSLVQLLKGVH